MRKWINLVETATFPLVLYHGTAILSLASIMVGDTISGNQQDDVGPEGVSFTTDLSIAWDFAKLRDHQEAVMEYPHSFNVVTPTMGAVIEIDGIAAKAAHRIRKTKGRDTAGVIYHDEAEYRLYGDMTSFQQLVTGIQCRVEDIDAAVEMLRSPKPNCMYDKLVDRISALEWLKKSHLLKRH